MPAPFIPLLVPIINTALDALRKRLEKEKRPDYQLSGAAVETALQTHLTYVEEWIGGVTFADLPGSRALRDVFVNLDISVVPRRLRIDDERPRTVSATSLAFGTRSVIVLGDPGAGKTTLLKRLCDQGLKRARENGKERLILLIVLRDLGPNETLIGRGLLEMGIGLAFTPTVNLSTRLQLTRRLFQELTKELNIVLYVDGLDEVSYDDRENVEADITFLLERTSNIQLFLTSRSGDYRQDFPNADLYEIEPLTDHQRRDFAHRWIGDAAEADSFLNELRESPFHDTAVRPLMLSHLCAIYLRTGKIPDKPKTVYRKAVYLLLREWDEQRGVRRRSRYSQFEPDLKQEFLEQLAFFLTRALSATRFSHEQLAFAYRSIAPNHGLPAGEAIEVAREIESHTGLLVQSGYEAYEFAHKSLQEYLAAEYIVKFPGLPEDRSIAISMPNELAIAVALSSSPADYLAHLILTLFLDIDRVGIDERAILEPDVGERMSVFFYRLIIEKPNIAYSERLTAAFLYLIDALAERFVAEAAVMNEEWWLRSANIPDFALRTLGALVHFISKENEVTEGLKASERYYETVSETDLQLIQVRRESLANTERAIPEFYPPKVVVPKSLTANWSR